MKMAQCIKAVTLAAVNGNIVGGDPRAITVTARWVRKFLHETGSVDLRFRIQTSNITLGRKYLASPPPSGPAACLAPGSPVMAQRLLGRTVCLCTSLLQLNVLICRIPEPPQKTVRDSRAVLAMLLLLFGLREDIMDRYQDAEASF